MKRSAGCFAGFFFGLIHKVVPVKAHYGEHSACKNGADNLHPNKK